MRSLWLGSALSAAIFVSSAGIAYAAPPQGDPVAGLMVISAVLISYFLPSIIAFGRGHHQRAAILLTNLLLGWTVLGWIAALIWSATATPGKVSV
ncbi:hypothetical protein ACVMAJ_000981 [Bradyrhizobium sp. USDA 4448]